MQKVYISTADITTAGNLRINANKGTGNANRTDGLAHITAGVGNTITTTGELVIYMRDGNTANTDAKRQSGTIVLDSLNASKISIQHNGRINGASNAGLSFNNGATVTTTTTTGVSFEFVGDRINLTTPDNNNVAFTLGNGSRALLWLNNLDNHSNFGNLITNQVDTYIADFVSEFDESTVNLALNGNGVIYSPSILTVTGINAVSHNFANDIYIDSAINNTSTGDLTINAGKGIYINANITTAGNLTLNANAVNGTVNRTDGLAFISAGDGVNLNASGNIIITMQNGATANTDAKRQSGVITLQNLNSSRISIQHNGRINSTSNAGLIFNNGATVTTTATNGVSFEFIGDRINLTTPDNNNVAFTLGTGSRALVWLNNRDNNSNFGNLINNQVNTYIGDYTGAFTATNVDTSLVGNGVVYTTDILTETGTNAITHNFANDVYINSAVNNPSTGALTLNVAKSLFINANITTGGDININANSTNGDNNRVDGIAFITANAGNSITAAGDIKIDMQNGANANTDAKRQSGVITLQNLSGSRISVQHNGQINGASNAGLVFNNGATVTTTTMAGTSFEYAGERINLTTPDNNNVAFTLGTGSRALVWLRNIDNNSNLGNLITNQIDTYIADFDAPFSSANVNTSLSGNGLIYSTDVLQPTGFTNIIHNFVNDVYIDSEINNTSAGDLTINAGKGIYINANITTAGNLTLNANATTGNTNRTNGKATIKLATGKNITASKTVIIEIQNGSNTNTNAKRQTGLMELLGDITGRQVSIQHLGDIHATGDVNKIKINGTVESTTPINTNSNFGINIKTHTLDGTNTTLKLVDGTNFIIRLKDYGTHQLISRIENAHASKLFIRLDHNADGFSTGSFADYISDWGVLKKSGFTYSQQSTDGADDFKYTVNGDASKFTKVYDNSTHAETNGITFTVKANNNRYAGVVFANNSPSLALYNSKDVSNANTIYYQVDMKRVINGHDVMITGITHINKAGTITPKALSVSGLGINNKVYDGNTNAVVNGTASLVGVEGIDAVTIDITNATYTFNNKNVNNNIWVNTSGITIGGYSSTNYTIVQPVFSASITPRTITVSGTVDTRRVYNGSTIVDINTPTYTNTIAGEVPHHTGSMIANLQNKNVGNAKSLTLSGLTLADNNSFLAGNYTIAYDTTKTIDITPRDITVSATFAPSREYNGSASVNITAPSFTNVVSGETVSHDNSLTASMSDKNVGNGKIVTLSGLNLLDNGSFLSANYRVLYATPTINITKKQISVSGLSVNNKVYDGNTTATATGSPKIDNSQLISGDNISVDISQAQYIFDNKNVGNNINITINNASLSGTDAGNYSLNIGLSANITPKNITVSATTASNRVYNGSTNVNATNPVLVGAINGETPAHTGTLIGSIANHNVGNGKVISLNGLTLSNNGSFLASNYNIVYDNTNTINITPKALTISGLGINNKVYDGNTTATATGTVTFVGLESVDTVSPDMASASYTFDNKNVGNNKLITVSGITLSGANAGNYTLTQPTGLTANITPRNITVSATTASSRVYNGSTNVNATNRTFTNTISGETPAHTGMLIGSIANRNVGNAKLVSLNGLTLSNNGAFLASNYNIVYNNTNTINITPKALTISGLGINNKVYDGNTTATATGTVTFVGLESVDTVSPDMASASYTFDNKNVGNNKLITVSGITLSGANAGNYTLTQPTGLTANITPKNLTVSGTTVNRQYNGLTSVNVNNPVFTGAVNGESPATTGTLVGTMADKNAGNNKVVTLSGITLNNNGSFKASNYTLVYAVGNTVDISQKSLNVSGISISNKVYDGNNIATASGNAILSGLINGDNVRVNQSNARYLFSDSNVATNKNVSASGLTIYGSEASNYTLNQPTGLNANIIPKDVFVSADVASSRTYNGNTNINVINPVLQGLLSGQAPANNAWLSASVADKNVGNNKPITFSGSNISDNGDFLSANYNFIYSTTKTINIVPKTITLSADLIEREYNANTTVQSQNMVISSTGIDSGSGTEMPATSGSLIGTMADKNSGKNKQVVLSGITLIDGTNGFLARNYRIVYDTTKTVNIKRKKITVSGVITGFKQKQYDGNNKFEVNPDSQITYDGFITGDIADNITNNVNKGFRILGLSDKKQTGAVNIKGFTLSNDNYMIDTTNITTRNLLGHGWQGYDEYKQPVAGAVDGYKPAQDLGSVRTVQSSEIMGDNSNKPTNTKSGSSASNGSPVVVAGSVVGGLYYALSNTVIGKAGAMTSKAINVIKFQYNNYLQQSAKNELKNKIDLVKSLGSNTKTNFKNAYSKKLTKLRNILSKLK